MPDSERQWLTIDDFTPGIYSAPGSRRNTSGFPTTGIHAPLGSARHTDTYGCLPGPNGKGLIPGFWSPVIGDDSSWQHRFTEAQINDAKINPPYQISGFNLMSFGDGTKFAVMAVVYCNDDGKMTWKLMRDTTNVATDVALTANQHFFGTQFAPQRLYHTAPYAFPGIPVIGFGYGIHNTTGWTTGSIGWFPDPSAMGVDGVQRIGFHGYPIAHQNRLGFVIYASNSYKLGNTSTYIDRDEGIVFTDPPNANVVPGTYPAIFFPENPSGFTSWGSLSASELLLIKRQGGAILLQGDVQYPQITYLPGVQSTGNMMSVQCVCALGVVYASDGAGVWAWAGGSTAEKISPQLDDSFYRYSQQGQLSFEDGTGFPVPGPSFQAFPWNDYLFCSGGWIYHIPTKGWWLLDTLDGNLRQFQWFDIDPFGVAGAAVGGVVLWAMHAKAQLVTGTTYRAGYKFPLNRYATTWHWRSHPIKVGDPTKDVQIDEIVLWLSRDNGGVGDAQVVLNVYGPDNTVIMNAPVISVTDIISPAAYRFQMTEQHEYIEIGIQAANNDPDSPAPMLHAIDIGYRESNLKPAS